MQKPLIAIFKMNPVVDQLRAILTGDKNAHRTLITDRKSGQTAFKLKRFPTSASEANNPQTVPRREK